MKLKVFFEKVERQCRNLQSAFEKNPLAHFIYTLLSVFVVSAVFFLICLFLIL